MDTTQSEGPPAKALVQRRGLKIALAVSVALNLAVAGLVGGAMLHDSGEGGRGDNMTRDLGFGLFDGALQSQDRDNLRRAIQERFDDLRAARQQMQSDAQAILAALKATPFDPAALSAAMDAQTKHLGARLDFGNSVVRDFLLALPDEARLAFADRLEQRMRRRSGGPGGQTEAGNDD